MKKLSNSEFVEIVYRNHHTWIKQVAYNLTNNVDDADDLTQELYAYLMQMVDINKIQYGQTVNLFYVYKILRSKFLNSIKQSKKITILPVEEDFLEIEDTEYSLERDAEFEGMLEITKHLLETDVHWFDAKLLQTYIGESHSIASLHTATGISKSSIWTSLTKTKIYIKNSYAQLQQASGSTIC